LILITYEPELNFLIKMFQENLGEQSTLFKFPNNDKLTEDYVMETDL